MSLENKIYEEAMQASIAISIINKELDEKNKYIPKMRSKSYDEEKNDRSIDDWKGN